MVTKLSIRQALSLGYITLCLFMVSVTSAPIWWYLLSAVNFGVSVHVARKAFDGFEMEE